MPSPTETQIRQKIDKLADGKLSLDDFQQWFVPISWNIERSKDPSLIALVYEIDGILAESSSAHWSEPVVREVLANAIRPFASRDRICCSHLSHVYATGNRLEMHPRRPPINALVARVQARM